MRFRPTICCGHHDRLTRGAPIGLGITAARGGEAVRNFCPTCGGLMFGGVIGESESHTIYAGSLDDPSAFKPNMVIFNRHRPDWVLSPEGLAVFEALPGQG